MPKDMTMLDHFAVKFMPIAYRQAETGTKFDIIAETAYCFAESMMKAREKRMVSPSTAFTATKPDGSS